MTTLLPRARWRDILRGRSRLLGARVSAGAARGLMSPVEARVHLGLDYEDLEAEELRLLSESTRLGRMGMFARALLATLLSGKQNAKGKVISLFGIEPAMFTVTEAIDYVFAESADTRLIYFAHPHALNISLVDAEQRECLRHADVVFADGIGVRLGTRLLGGSLPSNLNGTDMFPLLCQQAAVSGRPLVLVGAKHDVVDECARRSRAAHPGLQIPIVSHGYLDDAASLALASELRDLDSPLVLVGMGSPVQEKWAMRYLSDLPRATVLTVGGLFDFFSGRMPRAPRAWRELGLEWLYRLWQEPKRMARRYLLGNPLFLLMIACQRIGLDPRKLAALPGTAWLLGVERKRFPRHEKPQDMAALNP